MTTLYLPVRQGVAAVRRRNGSWKGELVFDDAQSPAVAYDPLRPSTVYAATFGGGIVRSDDAGRAWRRTGGGVTEDLVWAVAVSARERRGDDGVVYAGTELSNLYRSEDGGDTWVEKPAMQDMPSRDRWSYPPKPDTHHVRCLIADPSQAGLIFIAVEQGALLRSEDGGDTVEDHNEQAKLDAHGMATHPDAPGRIYASAGDGYAESNDYGESWTVIEDGITDGYLYSIAVDPGDPDTVVITGAPDPIKAHNPRDPESTVYRRTQGGTWQEAIEGLPGRVGFETHHLGANPAEAGVFYLSTVHGDVYRSEDKGASWQQLEIEWPDGFTPEKVRAIVPAPE